MASVVNTIDVSLVLKGKQPTTSGLHPSRTAVPRGPTSCSRHEILSASVPVGTSQFSLHTRRMSVAGLQLLRGVGGCIVLLKCQNWRGFWSSWLRTLLRHPSKSGQVVDIFQIFSMQLIVLESPAGGAHTSECLNWSHTHAIMLQMSFT